MNKELSQSDYEEESNYSEESSQEELIEEYRDIDDFENYEVSNLGQIRNKKTGRILKPSDIGKGYLQVCLYQNNIRKFYFIHQLVAQSFLENPNNYSDVDHINGSPTNNNVQNLRWVSKSDNQKNKNSDNFGNKFIFIDQLPEDVVEVWYYSNHFFNDYYWSETLNQLYFNNGVRIREVRPVKHGESYIYNCRSKQNDRVSLYITKLQKGLFNNQ
ncbi:HNH_endonuclease [Hexamita inflata]|uniref:HNH endonuclease n=1 Tax=Hexamita inflata TaxID=28002 RepID=A0AA86RCM3_9EUKA|nr:HNH endonuclease [Hexamita inflata]CAI9948470.1 HNH endonuclease [Hexamita inflata]CAI9970682.1 HNH endonuclease [Hexamita inflata]